jgi:hypothetical protein
MKKETLLRLAAQVVRANSDSQPISGIVNTAIKRGLKVAYKADSTVHAPGIDKIGPNMELVLADTTAPGAALRTRKAFFLERDVLSAPDYTTYRELEMRRTPEEVDAAMGEITPVKVGDCVAARDVQEEECEGTDFLHASVTGVLTVGTKLTLVDGKWCLLSSVTGDVAGIIVANIVPITAGNFRYRIEYTL